MKCVILAGGFGTRISEETHLKPKPMIEIGGKPILWHILKTYSTYGINEFIICCGYKGYLIKEYFANYFLHMSDVTFDMKNNVMDVHNQNVEPWKITLVDTGESTMTGGRLKRITSYLVDEENFCLTYGDGVSNIDISDLIKFHKNNNKMATLTAVSPPARFGAIDLEGVRVKSFLEKPKGKDGLISAGFFVFSPKILSLIEGDKTILETEILPKLAQKKELNAFNHDGFWMPMDTLRDKNYLEELWKDGNAPWKSW